MGTGPGDTVTLDLICGRCADLWVRWWVDRAQAFDEQLWHDHEGRETVRNRVASRAWATESPGMQHAGRGRWTPDERRDWPAGDEWDRVRFTCPQGCDTSPQVRLDNLEDAAVTVLRRLHSTGELPMVRTTVDRLLRLNV